MLRVQRGARGALRSHARAGDDHDPLRRAAGGGLREPLPADLYARLFPTGAQATEPPAEDAAAPRPARRGPGARPVLLQPSLHRELGRRRRDVRQPDAGRGAATSRSAPGVAATLPLVDGKISADYQPRLRFFASIPELDQTSHFLGANVELPLGSRIRVRASDAFTRAILEIERRRSRARVLLRPRALHGQRRPCRRRRHLGLADPRRSSKGVCAPPASRSPRPERRASSATTAARCVPDWATIWGRNSGPGGLHLRERAASARPGDRGDGGARGHSDARGARSGRS